GSPVVPPGGRFVSHRHVEPLRVGQESYDVGGGVGVFTTLVVEVPGRLECLVDVPWPIAPPARIDDIDQQQLPTGGSGCPPVSIQSTPAAPERHARRLQRALTNCPHC